MSNVLKVSVPGNITTSWASQPMGEITRFQAAQAWYSFTAHAQDHAREAWVKVLVEEYRANPIARNKKKLLWFLSKW